MFAYVFSKRKFNRVLTMMVLAWALDFVLRCVLYVYFGHDFVISNANRILGSFSGVFAGIAVTMMVIKRKSEKIPQPGQTGSHVK